MMARARWLRRNAARKFSSRSCISTTSACSSAASGTARAHGHADVRGGQAGRVVHAVADHRHLFALLRQLADRRDFFFRLQFGADVVQLQFGAHVFGGGFAVAGEHHGLQTFLAQFVHHLPRLRPDVVAQQNPPEQIALRHPDFRNAVLGLQFRRQAVAGNALQALRAGFQIAAPVCSAIQSRRPSRQTSPSRLARKPWPVTDSKCSNSIGVELLLFAVTRNGARERMRGKFFQRIGELRNFFFAAGRKTFDFFHSQFAGRQRAGFVERDGVHRRQFFHRRAAAKKNPVPRAPGNRRQHRGGNGKHQRARRRHDQQRHGAIKRAVRFELAVRDGKRREMKAAATTQKTSRNESPSTK